MVALMAQNSLLIFLSNPFIIAGLVLLVLGISLSLLASKFAMAARKTSNIQKNDKILVTCRTFGMLLICCGFICFIVGAAMLCGLF
ncbi:MAG: hypothetical protein IJZ26_00395 [Clostridia bacterium]|nr:hypothetical protein [Clostridia bacterium]